MNKFSAEECVVCMDCSVQVTFSPCRHNCVCEACYQQIERAKMDCPLCRAPIEGLTQEVATLTLKEHVEAFQARREEYVGKLRAKKAHNAMFKGNGKLARYAAAEISNHMERLQRENEGLARFGGFRIKYEHDQDEGLLRITYKVEGKRKLLKETAPYLDWEDLRAEVKDMDVTASDMIELATDYPAIFWLCKYHKQDVGALFKRRSL